jgi:hypothetical protein
MGTWLGKQESLCAGRWCTYEIVFVYLFIDCVEELKFMQESEEMVTLSACHEQKTQNLPFVLQFLSVSVSRRTAALHE